MAVPSSALLSASSHDLLATVCGLALGVRLDIASELYEPWRSALGWLVCAVKETLLFRSGRGGLSELKVGLGLRGGEARTYGSLGWPSVCVSKGLSLFSVLADFPVEAFFEPPMPGRRLISFLPLLPLLRRLSFPFAGSLKLFSGESPTGGGSEGLLKLACVRCAGSEGPALGVVRESSVSSEEWKEEDCVSDEGAECETGEQGSGIVA